MLIVVAWMHAPTPAAAWAPPATLNGETLSGSAVPTCDPITDTFTFSITSGTAAGPYPGTFTETGSVTPVVGLVTTFSAQFNINNGAITGTKKPPLTGINIAACPDTLIVHSAYSADLKNSVGEAFCDMGTVTTTIPATPTSPPGSFQEVFSSTSIVRGPCPP